MANDIQLTFSAEQRGLLNALEEQARAISAVGDRLQRVEKTSERLAGAQVRWGKSAAQVFNETRTPLERYNIQLGKLGDFYARGQINADTFRRAIAQQKQELADASKEAGGAAEAIGGFLAKAAGVASVTAALATAAAHLRAEVDNIRQRQGGAAETQLSFQDALSDAAGNLAGLMDSGEIKQAAMEASERTGIAPSKLLGAMSGAAASAGPTNKAEAKRVFGAAETMLQFAPELSPEDLKYSSAAAYDLANRFGMTDKQAIGFGSKVAGLSHVLSLQDTAKYVIPSVTNISKLGVTPEESGALVTALSKGMGDFHGRESGTASEHLVKQLRERYGDQESLTDLLGKIQSDPREQRKLLGVDGGTFKVGGKSHKFEKLSVESGAFASVNSLLTGGTDAETFRENLRSLTEGDLKGESDAQFERMIRAKNSTPEAVLAKSKRMLAAFKEREQVMDQGALGHVSRKGLSELLKAQGMSYAGQFMSGLTFEANTDLGEKDSLEEVRRQFAIRAKSLRAGTTSPGFSSHMGAAPSASYTPASETELRQASELDATVPLLNELIKLQRENNENQRKLMNHKPEVKIDLPKDLPRQPVAARLGR